MTVDDYFQVTKGPTIWQIRPKCSGGAFAEEASRAVWPDLLEQLGEAGCHVIVDLGSLSFFGSTMLDFIATVRKRLQDADLKIVLANVSDTGREVLEISRFDQFLDIYSTIEDAVAHLDAQ